MPRGKKKAPREPLYDAVIFDIDNVLVDTRQSYLEAIRWTVEIFLTEGKVPLFSGLKKRGGEPTMLSPADVEQFKMLGGFNDDWDCCYGLLTYFLTLPIRKRNLTTLKQKASIRKFVQTVSDRPLGVSGIVKLLGRPSAVTIEKISKIFQEIYLGKDIIVKYGKRQPFYWNKRGLMHKEKLVFKKRLLEKLKDSGVQLGIATGRSGFEASTVLKQFGLFDVFDAAITMDDIKKAEAKMRKSLRKPNPYCLVEVAKKIGPKKRFMYVGDLPDDVLAANQAKKFITMDSVGFPALANQKKKAIDQMKSVRPNFIIEKPAELLDVIMGKVKKEN